MTTVSLTTAKGRSKLDPRGKPHFVTTATPGIALAYRRLAGRAGSWSARVADGKGGNRLVALGAIADDLEPANGRDVLSFEQASDRAREVTRGPAAEMLTIAKALEKYETELLARGGLAGNVSRVRHHLSPSLVAKELSAVTAEDLQAFRDGIKAKPATVNRTIRILKAALGQAADQFETVWKKGLKQKPHQHEARNVVLTDDQVRHLVSVAYEQDQAFGFYVEVAAVTGARPSQIARLEVQDLQVERARVMMPTSKKGTGNKSSHIAVPITPALAAKLQVVAAGRAPSAALLIRSDGNPWIPGNNDHQRPFARAAAAAGLDPNEVTIYALRHSSIVRRIIANRTPLRTIAAIHDTSVVMIEKNYSRHIDRYDESAREGLLDTALPLPANVVAFAR